MMPHTALCALRALSLLRVQASCRSTTRPHNLLPSKKMFTPKKKTTGMFFFFRRRTHPSPLYTHTPLDTYMHAVDGHRFLSGFCREAGGPGGCVCTKKWGRTATPPPPPTLLIALPKQHIVPHVSAHKCFCFFSSEQFLSDPFFPLGPSCFLARSFLFSRCLFLGCHNHFFPTPDP